MDDLFNDVSGHQLERSNSRVEEGSKKSMTKGRQVDENGFAIIGKQPSASKRRKEEKKDTQVLTFVDMSKL